MTSFRYNGAYQTERKFLYGIRAQTLLPSKICPCLRTTKLSQRSAEGRLRRICPKGDRRAYFIILNKIDELDGTNEKLLKYYKENIEKYHNV